MKHGLCLIVWSLVFVTRAGDGHEAKTQRRQRDLLDNCHQPNETQHLSVALQRQLYTMGRPAYAGEPAATQTAAPFGAAG